MSEVRGHWEHIGPDADTSHEMHDDDAVLEFLRHGGLGGTRLERALALGDAGRP